MVIIHYFNSTYFETSPFKLTTEIYLISTSIWFFFDTFSSVLFMYILNKCKQFHINFSRIFIFLSILHIYDNIVVLFIRFLMLFEAEGSISTDHPIFKFALRITVAAKLTETSVLPALVLERFFATYYVNDYETKNRCFISCSLIVILTCLFIFFNFKQDDKLFLFSVLAIVVLNLISVIMSMFIGVYNRNQLKKNNRFSGCSKRDSIYSLTKRFQISENIRVSKFMQTFVCYMGFMNVLVNATLFISNLNKNPLFQSICTGILEVLLFVYSASVPLIMAKYFEKYALIQKKLIRKFVLHKMSSNSAVNPLRSSYGISMTDNSTADSHFENLKKVWSVQIKPPKN